MATTATAYGCCSAALPRFAAFPWSISARRTPPPPTRVSLVGSLKFRGTAPGLKVSCHGRRRSISACSSGEVSSDGAALPTEVTFDLKLPRRSLLVQFTCNKCGERTKRLINRVAYERGTVFLQCAGCLVYHKFVDNLGLVVEYDLRDENGIQEGNVVDTNSED
ncbi:hypothetical protein QOZ80_1AG0023650 [Eleusine coracana subsp. coracana]|nr:hypothetical protein QOZ80_1AG0023650 [Eleusine coracana subsp. coracana]